MGATADPLEETLAQTASGHRFVREETERVYEAWRFERSLGQRRTGVYVAAGFWVSFVLLLLVVQLYEPILPSVALMVPAIGALYVVIQRRSRRGVVIATLLSNALSGLLGVYLGFYVLDPELRAPVIGAIVLACLFQFGASNDPPLRASAGIAPYVVATLAMVVLRVADGEQTLAGMLFEVWLLVTAFAMGLLMARASEQSRRNDFCQARIIEEQRDTIARERARSQALLEQELGHQVAERSRELGAVLAKTNAALEVRRLVPGERFDVRYRVVAPLGAGGMGVVYEVERLTDGARLALKAVVGEVSGASAARFAREAEIGARIRHPNLVSIVDVGVSSGVPFLVMELVDGRSLEAHRERFGDVAWALPLLRQITEGLAALHDGGVVHRDLKPANVLLTDDAVAKISDFGISRFGALDESIDPNAATVASPKPSALTGTGMMLGTPLYMSPEAARGGRAVEGSADIFALGIIAYEMLTGRTPFSVPAVLLAMAQQPIPDVAPIETVDAALGALVLGCLAEDPAKRPRARRVLEELGPDR